MVEEQEVTIAGDGTHTADELGSVKMSDPPVKFSEILRDMDKLSIHEPTDGKPYPSLRLDPSFKKSLESKWSNSIILQLVGKSIAFDVLMEKIKFLWKLEEGFKFIDIGDNCFVFNSDCEATRLKILSEGPWIVNGCYLLPRTWIPQFCPSIDRITSTIACVRIVGLPVELYDDTVLFGIAKMLGRPIELDFGNCSATLSVEIDLDKPLKTLVMVEEMIYSVEYKNFSVICNDCEKIGHRNEDCSVNIVNRTSQNEEGVKEVAPTEEMLSIVEISPSRGPWMLVGSKRKKGTNMFSVSVEGDDSGNDTNHSSEKDEKTKKINDENLAPEVAVNVDVSTSVVVPKGSNTSTLNSISQESNLPSPSDDYPTKGQEDEDKRRNKSQAHLYTIVKVSLDKHLKDQIGKDLYFDLVNHDKVSSFRILKQMPFYQFKEGVAKKLGIPVQYMRFWKWSIRQNSTYRPHRPLTRQEQALSVAQLMGVAKNKTLNVFLEVEYGDLLHPIPYPKKTEEDNLIFLKLYDPYKEKLRYVGRLFVKGYATPAEIIPKLKELAGFSSVDDIELFEEIRFEPKVMCECLNKSISFTSSQIGDGDIICFQKSLTPNARKLVRYPDVPSYLESVKTRLVSKCKAA